MGKRLIIKRVGTLLPAFCLIVLVVLISTVIWLTTAGLPQFVVDKAEAAILQNGIPVDIGKIRLKFTNGIGLVADDVRIYTENVEDKPIITIDELGAGVEFLPLLAGKVKLKHAELKNGKISLPVSDVSDVQNLEASDINISASIKDNIVHLTESALNLQGIPIQLHGVFDISELMEGDVAEEEHEKLVLPALIKTCQSIIDRVYHQIEEQHWEQGEFPELNLGIVVTEQVVLRVEARAPKYDIAQFSFRNALLNLEYENDCLLIHSLQFDTYDPAAHVKLSGGYNVNSRHLSFKLVSNAALFEMGAELADGYTEQLLKKIFHEPDNPPQIALEAEAEFSESMTLNSAKINGEITQKGLRIGHSVVDFLHLSFYYNNGNFNINHLNLELPEGKLGVRATSSGGFGDAEISASLPVDSTLKLISEFTEKPISLPEGLQIGDTLNLTAKARLTMPEFKPGDSYKEHFVPSIRNLDAQISLNEFRYGNHYISKPSIHLVTKQDTTDTPLITHKATEVQIHLTGESLNSKPDAQHTIDAQDFSLDIELNNWLWDTAQGGSCQSGCIQLCAADTTLGINTPTDNGTDHYSAKQSSAKLNFSGLNITTDGAISCENAQANLMADALASPHINTGKLQSMAAVADLSCNNQGAQTGTAQCKLAIEQFEAGDTQARRITLSALAKGKPDTRLPHAISGAICEANISGISNAAGKQGDISVMLHLPHQDIGKLFVAFTPEATSSYRSLTIKADTDTTTEGLVKLNQLNATLPLSDLGHVLEQIGIRTKNVELPDSVALHGNAEFDLDALALHRLDAQVQIPHIVRTPHNIACFQGKKIPIGVQASVQAERTTNGAYNYNADLAIQHSTGKLQANVTGNTDTGLQVTGNNNIRADIVDALLDYQDAHDILRDFNLKDGATTDFRNIAVAVRYDNGLSVNVDTDLTLNNIQYQLNGYVIDADGNEVLNKELQALPFVDVTSGKAHLHVNWKEDMVKNGKTLPNVADVVLTDVTLIYDNRSWLKTCNFTPLGLSKTGPGLSKHKNTTLKGDKVVIDIENGAVRLSNVEGTVYPAYSLGMFYPDLREHLSILLMPYPAKISTLSCNFPIYSDSKENLTGHIQVLSPQLTGLDFLGTTIPLTRMTGFINLSNDSIFLDRMNALCWDGTLDAAVNIGISGKSTSFDGTVKALNLDLKKIGAAYDARLEPALCAATLRFRSPTPKVQDIQGYGQIRIVNGDLLSLSIFRPIGAFVSDITGNIKELDESAKQRKTTGLLTRLSRRTGSTINAIGTGLDKTAQYIPGYNHIFAYDLQNANIEYVLNKGHFTTRSFTATGYNLEVTGKVDINLDDLTLEGNMWPEVSSLPTILISPITFLSDFMLDIVIYGKVDDLKWEFRLDPRISASSPVTAQSQPNARCPKQQKKKSKKTKR